MKTKKLIILIKSKKVIKIKIPLLNL